MHVTAAEILEWAHGRKIPQIYSTNTTSRPRPAIADKVERMDIRIEPGWILTLLRAARRCPL
jgi:ribonucleotide monophosphatase NagD (HAD superfamily)